MDYLSKKSIEIIKSFEEADIIKLDSDEQIDGIIKWSRKHPELCSNFKPFLEKGVILTPDNDYHYFEVDKNDSNVITLAHIYKSEVENKELCVIGIRFSVRFNGAEGFELIKDSVFVSDAANGMSSEERVAMVSSIVTQLSTIYFALVIYVNNFKENAYIKSSTVSKINKKKKQKSKGKSKSNQSVKLITKNKYFVKDISLVENDSEKRDYSREVEKWTRRGHKRVYRDKITGEIKKTVWIEPHVCKANGAKGDKERKIKTYKI